MVATLQLVCEGVSPVADKIKCLRFRILGPRDERWTLTAGRYVQIIYPDTQGVRQQRCYSVTRVLSTNVFEVVVKRSGHQRVSDNLFDKIAGGDLLQLCGVGGAITVERLTSSNTVLLLAGGIGLTLPIALVRELKQLSDEGQQVPHVTLLACSSVQAEMPFQHELTALAANENWFSANLHVTREPASLPLKEGRLDSTCIAAMSRPDTVVICGSGGFAKSMRALVLQSFPQADILVEAFSPVASEAVPIPAAMAEGARLQVAGTGVSLPLQAGRSLLDHLLDEQVAIANECRSGICGSCKVRLVEGECQHEMDFALAQHERDQGYVLACCCYPKDGSLTIAI